LQPVDAVDQFARERPFAGGAVRVGIALPEASQEFGRQ
jgi:hypothetical protein